jgi:hypothetical protein
VEELIGDIIAASMSLLGEFHLHHYTAVAQQFMSRAKVIGVRAFGNGNLNDSYRVTMDINEEAQFVSQRINGYVLKQAKLIMLNRSALTEHMQRASKVK